jgi:hypothetical protein
VANVYTVTIRTDLDETGLNKGSAAAAFFFESFKKSATKASQESLTEYNNFFTQLESRWRQFIRTQTEAMGFSGPSAVNAFDSANAQVERLVSGVTAATERRRAALTSAADEQVRLAERAASGEIAAADRAAAAAIDAQRRATDAAENANTKRAYLAQQEAQTNSANLEKMYEARRALLDKALADQQAANTAMAAAQAEAIDAQSKSVTDPIGAARKQVALEAAEAHADAAKRIVAVETAAAEQVLADWKAAYAANIAALDQVTAASDNVTRRVLDSAKRAADAQIATAQRSADIRVRQAERFADAAEEAEQRGARAAVKGREEAAAAAERSASKAVAGAIRVENAQTEAARQARDAEVTARSAAATAYDNWQKSILDRADIVTQQRLKEIAIVADAELRAATRGREIHTEAARVTVEAAQRAEQAQVQAAEHVIEAQERARNSTNSLSASQVALAAAVGTVVARIFERLASGLKTIASETVQYASRTEELGYALSALAKQNNISTGEIIGQELAIRRLNITTQGAREVMSKMILSQLDLASAFKLASAAQDLGVIVGKSTQEEYEHLTQAIITLQPRMLRTAGVFTNLQEAMKAYSKETGLSTKEMTTFDKQQALLNQVLIQGARATGTYDQAMNSAAKQMRSLTDREIPELQNVWGGFFQGPFKAGIEYARKFVEIATKFPLAGAAIVIAITAVAVATLGLTAATEQLAIRIVALSRAALPYLLPGLVLLVTGFGNAHGKLMLLLTVLPLLIPVVRGIASAINALRLAEEAEIATRAVATAGITALIALAAAAIIALISWARAEEEVAGADERRVLALTNQVKVIKEDIEWLDKHAEAEANSQGARGRTEQILLSLQPVQRAQILSLGAETSELLKNSDARELMISGLRQLQEQRQADLNSQIDAARRVVISEGENIARSRQRQDELLKEEKRLNALTEAERKRIELSTSQRASGVIAAGVLSIFGPGMSSRGHGGREAFEETIQATTDVKKAIDDVSKTLATGNPQWESQIGLIAAYGREMKISAKEAMGLARVQDRDLSASQLLAINRINAINDALEEQKNKYRGVAGAIRLMKDELENIEAPKPDMTITFTGILDRFQKTADQLKGMIEGYTSGAVTGTATTVEQAWDEVIKANYKGLKEIDKQLEQVYGSKYHDALANMSVVTGFDFEAAMRRVKQIDDEAKANERITETRKKGVDAIQRYQERLNALKVEEKFYNDEAQKTEKHELAVRKEWENMADTLANLLPAQRSRLEALYAEMLQTAKNIDVAEAKQKADKAAAELAERVTDEVENYRIKLSELSETTKKTATAQDLLDDFMRRLPKNVKLTTDQIKALTEAYEKYVKRVKDIADLKEDERLLKLSRAARNDLDRFFTQFETFTRGRPSTEINRVVEAFTGIQSLNITSATNDLVHMLEVMRDGGPTQENVADLQFFVEALLKGSEAWQRFSKDSPKEAKSYLDGIVKTLVESTKYSDSVGEMVRRLGQEITKENTLVADMAATSSLRYELEWKRALNDVALASDAATISMIRSQVKLADQTIYHADQANAKVMEYLASQSSVTDVIAEARIGVIQSTFSYIESGLDRITSKLGAIGGVLKQLLMGFIQIAMTRFFQALYGTGGGAGAGAGGGSFTAVLNNLNRATTGGGAGGASGGSGGGLAAVLGGGGGSGGGGFNLGGFNIPGLAGGGGSAGGSVSLSDAALANMSPELRRQLSLAALDTPNPGAAAAGATGIRGALGTLPGMLGSMAPMLGVSMGAMLGGSSRSGQVLGGLGGGLAGLLVSGLMAGGPGGALLGGMAGNIMGAIGLTGVLGAATLGIGAAVAVIGSVLMARNAARRRDETTRNTISTDTGTAIWALIDKARLGDVTLAQAQSEWNQIRDNYFKQISQIKDSKTRRHAELQWQNDFSPLWATVERAARESEKRQSIRSRMMPVFQEGGFVKIKDDQLGDAHRLMTHIGGKQLIKVQPGERFLPPHIQKHLQMMGGEIPGINHGVDDTYVYAEPGTLILPAQNHYQRGGVVGAQGGQISSQAPVQRTLVIDSIEITFDAEGVARAVVKTRDFGDAVVNKVNVGIQDKKITRR